MIEEEYRGARQWSRKKQALFSVLWLSFLCAAVGTMVFFAVFDPGQLIALIDEDINVAPDVGYAVGFFFFWLFALGCSGMTAFLVRTAPKRDNKHRASQN